MSPPSSDARSARAARATVAAAIVIGAATLWAFAGAWGNEFVNWDDDYLLVDNQAYLGLTAAHFRWFFTTTLGGHYQPLTWLSYAIDCARSGRPDPVGVHLTNVCLHLFTALGFFFVARRVLQLAGADGNADEGWRVRTAPGECGAQDLPSNAITLGATLAALLFALHPLRVESVAWATERRDVLSGAWLMLATFLYLRAVSRRGVTGYRAALAGSLACYALSLLSKAAGVMFPLVLLVLDVYPLRRLRPARGGDGDALRRSVWMEKLLFALPAAAIAVVAVLAQRESGALRSAEDLPFSLRLGQAGYGVGFYIWKTLWPAGLLPLYEQRPEASAFDLPCVLGAVFTCVATAGAWWARRRLPSLLAAWTVYVLLLLPVLGFFQSGPQVVADRYSYLSCMPWAVLAGAVGARMCRGKGIWPALPAIALLVAVVAGLGALTRKQVGIWRNSQTLWTAVLERAPHTGTAHANLAAWLNRRGDHEAACTHAREALRILPGSRVAHIALGRCSAELGAPETAEAHFAEALRIRPDDEPTALNLVNAHVAAGHADQALEFCEARIAAQPARPLWRLTLGTLLARRQRFAEARVHLVEAVRADPAAAEARFRLSVVQLALDDPAAAIATLEEGLARAPDDALLGAQLAWIYATCRRDDLRNGVRALELARKAMKREAEVRPQAQRALAAALAENGDFAAAIAALREVLADEPGIASAASRERLQAQLAQYERGEPTRE
ncbi:MAG: tetratricopeptide repeat protein [Planctomycetes bacterium]|nr:tetratricopeptide repeat protein [Planctomycetota bacterium]